MEKELANVFIFGKRYSVPSSLTVMDAMEYAGYKLVRGCGCRSGFCGACATIYRIKGQKELKVCLSCQTQVVDGMYLTQLPFFPGDKKVFDINDIETSAEIMKQLYPEIYSCIGCNACTKGCPQELNVMQYIAYAQRGDFENAAHESFDCVGCGICSSRCPAQITHPNVGLLARRITGKYINKETSYLTERVSDIENGKFDVPLSEIMGKTVEEIKALYDIRDIEK